jgi:hypothetical protein
MTLVPAFLFTAVAAASLVLPRAPWDTTPQQAACRDVQECRQLATDALERGEFEAFHDFAWRAVQKGPRNDPALMYLLARAQSLSGRPHDALVMLRRLAAMGVATDAAMNDDFRRVRALPAWAELQGEIPPTARLVTEAGGKAPSRSSNAETPVASTGVVPGRSSEPGVSGTDSARSEMLRFTLPQFTPAGLAYDAVSRRFIVGDRLARKLAVVDEFSTHVANLASAQGAGFRDVAALEIDPQEGTLWVVSGGDEQTALHKLQLVSGRSLGTYVVPESFGPTRLTDVAATPQRGVLALDAVGHRLFRLSAKRPSLELAANLADGRPSSVAPVSDAVVYVAHDGGLTRVDLGSRVLTEVKAAAPADLSGLARIRWHRGSLIAIQRAGEGYRAIRIALDRAGRRATGIDVLDGSLSTTDPTAATVSGGVLYYLASGEGSEMIVRRVSLR